MCVDIPLAVLSLAVSSVSSLVVTSLGSFLAIGSVRVQFIVIGIILTLISKQLSRDIQEVIIKFEILKS